MRITKIARQKRNKNYVSLHLDGKYAFSLSDETIVKLKLKEGMEVDPAAISDVIAEDEKRRAVDYAWTLLGIRSRSVKELQERMARKAIPKEAVAYAVDRLKELGYLGDERFARDWVAMRCGQGKGPELIRMELRKKGVSGEIIAETMQGFKEDREEEFERVKRIALQKLRSMKREEPRAMARKLMGFLARRGFSPETVIDVLRDLRLEMKEDEEHTERID